jgi:hypothetical protein
VVAANLLAWSFGMRFTQFSIGLIIAPFACLCAQLAAAAVTVQNANFGEGAAVQPTTEIRLQVDRLPTAEEGRIAIFIGRTDVTSQFRIDGTQLIYQPMAFLLPVGESQVTVYLVKGNEWREIAQLPLHVSRQTPTSDPVTQAPASVKPEVPAQSQPEVPEASPEPSTEAPPGQAETSASALMQPEAETSGVEIREQFGEQQSPEQSPAETEQSPEQATPEQSEKLPEQSPEHPSEQSTEDNAQPQAETTSPEAPEAEAPEAETSTDTTGFSFSLKPRVNTTIKSQFRENRSQDAGESERPTFTDATVESGFESELKWGQFTLQSRASFLGVTFQPEALRFGELQETAPKFDLSEYQIDAIWGPVQFSMGHLCYGNHPFLLDNFCSRGLTLKAQINDRIDVSVNSMSANSIVGFSNFSGLNDFDNNLTSATLGVQLVKNNASGIRFEATLLNGERKPVGDFNEGEVVDAEKSRGFGLRLFGSDNSGRLRFDAGFARSRFTNPPDRQLIEGDDPTDDLIDDGGDGDDSDDSDDETPDDSEPIEEEPVDNEPIDEPIDEPVDEPVDDPGAEPINEPIEDTPIPDDPINAEPVGNPDVVDEPIEEPDEEIPNEGDPFEEQPTGRELEVIPVEPVTRNALYAEVSYDVLREVSLGENHTASLTINARHERVDPQFQTLGASVTADQLRNLIGLNASIAGASIQFQQEWSEDNLANVPTILKTKTRNTTLNVNVPLQTVLGSQSQFLPTLSYSYQRVRQFGANFPIPDLSGFDETEIPDQLNTQHQVGLEWAFDNLSLSYQFSKSFQDNRQPSRENADFRNATNQLSLSWQVSSRFQLSVGYGWTSAESIEEGITRFSASPTIGFSWEFLKGVTLAMNFNRSDNFDSLENSFSRGDSLEAVLTWNFAVTAGSGFQIPGSAFIRYSRQANRNRDNVFSLSTDSTIEIINAGLSFSF